MRRSRIRVPYFGIVAAVAAVALLGSWLTSQGVSTWYETLVLPTLAPEGELIGWVWTIVFILSAIAVILIWQHKRRFKNFSTIIGWLWLNAVLNVAWSWIFFVQHWLGWAVAEMIFLNLTTLIVIVLVWKKVRLAGYLLLPYFVWVSFATYLAWQIYLLN